MQLGSLIGKFLKKYLIYIKNSVENVFKLIHCKDIRGELLKDRIFQKIQYKCLTNDG